MTQDKAGNELESNEVFCVQMHILNMWVCAPKDMTMKEVQSAVDRMPPAGTSAGWQVQHDPDNKSEEFLSPGRCDEDCNRQHWNCLC